MQLQRKQLVTAGVALGIVGAMVYLLARSKEPTYQGKTSAQWFWEFRAAKARLFAQTAKTMPGFGPGMPFLVFSFDERQLARDPAAAGLRALGTNAALCLAREFCRGDASWALPYRRFLTKVPSSRVKFLPNAPEPRSFVREEVAQALGLLGTNAPSAIPAMVRAMSRFDPVNFSLGLRTLERVPARPLCQAELIE